MIADEKLLLDCANTQKKLINDLVKVQEKLVLNYFKDQEKLIIEHKENLEAVFAALCETKQFMTFEMLKAASAVNDATADS